MPPPGKPGIRNTLPFVGPDGQTFQPPRNEPPGNPLNDEIASLRGRLSQAELDIRELRNVQFIDEPARTRITTLEGQMATLYPSHTHDYSTLTGIPSSFTPSTHNHDSAYSALGHNHDSAYSALSHNHSGVYSLTSHNHDSAYSALGHNHDSAYSALSHTHAYSSLTSIPSSFPPDLHGNSAHSPSFADSAHIHDAYASSTHNHDSAYSGAGHNHDSSYSGTSHTHAYSSLTSIPTSFTPSNHGNTAHIPDFAADSNYIGLQNAFNSHTHSYHDDWNGSGGFTTRTTSGPTPTW